MLDDWQYSPPEGVRIYAIGDVHGHLEPLKAMHEDIAMDLARSAPERVRIIYMGDYVDRGPDSRGVIDYLLERKHRGDGIEKTFLAGNHEGSMMRFLHADDPASHASWLQWGGLETLASYGAALDQNEAFDVAVRDSQARFRVEFSPEHMDFMDGLSFMASMGDYVFAHAGVHPERSLADQKKGHLLSIREPFLSWDRPLGFCVVHGHTVTSDKKPEILPHRIGIDTGFYDGGALSCVVLEGTDVRFLSVGV